tara:strand:+ start:952 stop:2367 length:1416 start_codon:yes stop_codon:yes gene_type:complete
MANKFSNNEASPANTDDALEGPQRIREIKQTYNERLNRDHFVSDSNSQNSATSTLAVGAESGDSGYHRRITIKEEQSAQANSADQRLNTSNTGINAGTDATSKMAEIWVEKHSGTSDETSILLLGTEGAGNQRTVITDSQTQVLTNKTLTAPVINDAVLSGGSGGIDGVPIGQREAEDGPPVITAGAAAGKFTTLESTGATTIGAADTDTLTLKAKTSGLSTDATPTAGYSGANQFYAGIVGEIRMFAGSSEPEGWIFCDGRQLLHTGTGNFSELYAAIGLAYTDTSVIDESAYGSSGNRRSSIDYFRIPNLAGRIPVGSGQGRQTNLAEDDGPITDLKSDTLTNRTLGDYGAAETHTLTAGESGAGPHYHPAPIVDPGHNHDFEAVKSWGDHDDYRIEFGPGPDLYNQDTSSDTTGITVKAGSPISTTEAVEDNNDAFRVGKTDLNTGVKAASAHTQMQPFIVMNYIIKY